MGTHEPTAEKLNFFAEKFKRVIPYLTIGKRVISEGGKVKQLEAQVEELRKAIVRLVDIKPEFLKEA
jgi:hypothetical protein